jgi:hypothetical protein
MCGLRSEKKVEAIQEDPEGKSWRWKQRDVGLDITCLDETLILFGELGLA